jgi:hypothetical protein
MIRSSVLSTSQQEGRHAWRTVAAILVIKSSGMTPGPLGISDTNPSADAPILIAKRASSTLPMQHTFTRDIKCSSLSGMVGKGRKLRLTTIISAKIPSLRAQ